MTPAAFQFDSGAVVRTYADDQGEPWFNANDVCAVLGYANPRQAVQKNCRTPGVSKRDMGVVTGQKATGEDAIQQVEQTFINEGNLYRLIIKSRKPEAERFEAWVCDEVLPTIRKSGRYVQPGGASGGQIGVELGAYLALLDGQVELANVKAELAKLRAGGAKAKAKNDIASTLMWGGRHSREEIAVITGMKRYIVDFIYADLCSEAARQGIAPPQLATSHGEQ